MPLKLVTPPTAEPVTLAEAKVHARVTETALDNAFDQWIVVARVEAEHIMRRQVVAATYDLTLDAFPAVIELPRPPLQSVTSLTYVDTDGVTQTLAAELYSVVNVSDAVPAMVVPAYGEAWPATRAVPGAVTVRYSAGWATAADVPEAIKQWIILRVAWLYEGGDDASWNNNLNRLLDAYCVPEVV